MKKYIIILILLSFSACFQNMKDGKTRIHSENEKVNKNSVKEYYYKGFNGRITDTIQVDSSIDKTMITDTKVIKNILFIAYSKSSVKYSSRHDSSLFYIGHFINTYMQDHLPAKRGILFKSDRIVSRDIEINIGQLGSFDSNLTLEQFKSLPFGDSSIYIHAIASLDNNLYNHQIIQKIENHFVKLFEFISSDYLVKFNKIDGNRIQCNYNYTTEDTSIVYTLKYDFLKKQIINN